MTRRMQIVVLLLILLGLFIAINIFSVRFVTGVRLDATEGSIYTLTEATRNVARSPEEPVDLRFYFSSRAARGQPEFEAYARRVREMLQEIASASGGKVRLTVIDPEPFSESEDDAVRDGLVGVPVGGGQTLYFGLVGENSVEMREAIPFFDIRKERFLEYEVARLIYSLAHPKRHVVGLLTSLSMEGGFTIDPRTRQPTMTRGWRILDEIKGLYEVRTIRDPGDITADIDVLLVAHPKNLTDEMLFAIDQYVLRGGHLLAFIDPWCEADDSAGQFAFGAQRSSGLAKLLDAWGVESPSDLLAADESMALRVYLGEQRNAESLPYVVWLGCDERSLSRDDPITGGLKQVIVGTAGFIRAREGAQNALTITPLIRTTDKAMMMPRDALMIPPDPKALLKRYTPGSASLVLAARLGGKAKTAFPDGVPGEKKDDSPVPLAESAGDVAVVLVADCDLLSDSMWVRVDNFFGQQFARKISDNADFVMSALDNLMGSSDLLAIRARRDTNRPFKVVEEMRLNADKRTLSELEVLQAKADETEKRLRELQAQRDDKDKGIMLTPEQVAEIEKLRREQIETRRAIREAQRSLRADIERLGRHLKFINIALMPILVSLFALGVGLARRARRAAARRTE
jgi:ABC-type uncharacterized transport system involved in gliding motility auxiliary subunit